MASSLSKSIIGMNDNIDRNGVESNSYNTSVNRIKLFFEDLEYTDSISVGIPVLVEIEYLGITPYFRFDYGRFDYDRFSDIGGTDDVVVNIV